MPVIPPEQEILPSLDDEVDEAQDDDEEDEVDDDDDMMADEAADTDDEEYDSDEDVDDRDPDDDSSWDSLSTPRGKLAQKDGVAITSTTTASTTQRATEAPTFAMASSVAPIDPYFTHFDPRAEHQSYKVKVRNFIP